MGWDRRAREGSSDAGCCVLCACMRRRQHGGQRGWLADREVGRTPDGRITHGHACIVSVPYATPTPTRDE
jgi:hypothetical protein